MRADPIAHEKYKRFAQDRGSVALAAAVQTNELCEPRSNSQSDLELSGGSFSNAPLWPSSAG
jgi:hypothetical protein